MKKVAYFEKNDTLAGYIGPTVEDILGEFGIEGDDTPKHMIAADIVTEAENSAGGDIAIIKKIIDRLEAEYDDPIATSDSRNKAARELRRKYNL